MLNQALCFLLCLFFRSCPENVIHTCIEPRFIRSADIVLQLFIRNNRSGFPPIDVRGKPAAGTHHGKGNVIFRNQIPVDVAVFLRYLNPGLKCDLVFSGVLQPSVIAE